MAYCPKCIPEGVNTEYDYFPVEFVRGAGRTIVQRNGTEKLGDLKGATPPPQSCELHIKHLKSTLRLINILPHFAKFGPIYNARLMLAYNGDNRGFGFIKFCNEQDAQKAMFIMNNNGMISGTKILVEPSLNRTKLYVGFIPTCFNYEEARKRLWLLVKPKFKNLIMYRDRNDPTQHAGFAILDFNTHEEALEVKRTYNTGVIYMTVDEYATVAWAKMGLRIPPTPREVEDCYETFRLTCMANYINVPIILFGTLVRDEGIQYCAIILRSNITQNSRAIFFEVNLVRGLDILSRISDIATILLVLDEGFLKDNYIIKSDSNTRSFIGAFTEQGCIKQFVPPDNQLDYNISYWEEIVDLRSVAYALTNYTPRGLLHKHHSNLNNSYLDNFVIEDRLLLCLNFSYRMRPDMKLGITNDELLFIVCYRDTRANLYYNRENLPSYTLTPNVHFSRRMNLYCASYLRGYDCVYLRSPNTLTYF